jgi:hypothetical protein
VLLGGVPYQVSSEEKPLNLLSIQGENTLLPERLAQTLGAERVHLNRVLTAVKKSFRWHTCTHIPGWAKSENARLGACNALHC